MDPRSKRSCRRIWAAHEMLGVPEDRRDWTITHVPSGMRLDSGRSPRGKRLPRRLGAPWPPCATMPMGKLVADALADQVRQARRSRLPQGGRVNDRRTAAASTLRELSVELEYRRAELAALERAHDILERAADEHGDRCDSYHPDSPCAGELYSRFCRLCGDVVKRCQEHGGIRAATYAADDHRAEAHAGQHARPCRDRRRGPTAGRKRGRVHGWAAGITWRSRSPRARARRG
jgi:hypothetical protein